MTMHKPLLLLSLAFAVPAYGHQTVSGWTYPPTCCSGNEMTGDCAMIPASTVKVVAGGFEITLLPGQHRKVTKPQTYFVTHQNARHSKDSDFHICLYPTEDRVQCFFAPPFGA